MTKRELSQLYYLSREIGQQKKRLRELETAAASCPANITGMPHVSGVTDKTGAYAAEIADLKGLVELNVQKCIVELNRLNRYIEGVEESQTREIFRLRYINGLSWQQVAFSIGEYDESYPRRIHNNYLKRAENAEPPVLK